MNEELQFFLTKARRSLNAANAMRDRGDHDFASSRAYYAMFYIAEMFLWSLGQTYSSHAQTMGAFGREFAKTGKLDPKYHRWLIDAEDIRKTGDYETRILISPEESAELCHHAKEFIEVADDYFGGAPE